MEELGDFHVGSVVTWTVVSLDTEPVTMGIQTVFPQENGKAAPDPPGLEDLNQEQSEAPVPLNMVGLYTATTPKPAQGLGDDARCFLPAGPSQLLSGEGQIQG